MPRQRAGDNSDRWFARAHIFVRPEVSPRDQTQAQRVDQTRRAVVLRRLHASAAFDGIDLLRSVQRLLARASASGSLALIQRQRITDRHRGLDARKSAQCRQIGGMLSLLILSLLDARALDHGQGVLGHAGGHADSLYAAGNHECYVADDGAGKGYLQRQQGRGELVSTQGRKYRAQLHAGYTHEVFNCSAGCTRQARHAGSRPATTLATMASASVPSSIGISIWASCA
jgi:hypothetical protein